jgi:hypothetical protein
MPAVMNKENVDIPPNHDLSDIDKAYMAINYPRDLSSVKKALQIIDLDSNTKSAIIKAHEEQDVLEMRRLLAAPPSSFPSRSPFLGTSHSVVAIIRTIRCLPETLRPMLFKSTTLQPEAVVSTDATNIVQNIPNRPSSSSSPISPSGFSTLAKTGSIVSFNSQTTVSTHVCTNTFQIGSVESPN